MSKTNPMLPFVPWMQIPMIYMGAMAKIGQMVVETNMAVAQTMREAVVLPKRTVAA